MPTVGTVDDPESVRAKPLTELVTAAVDFFRHLQDGLTDLQA
jgi:hypothetical protein